MKQILLMRVALNLSCTANVCRRWYLSGPGDGGPDLALRPGFDGEGAGEGNDALPRGLVLSSAGLQSFRVRRHCTPCAETVLDPRSHMPCHDDHSRLLEVAKQGCPGDLSVCLPRLIYEKCLAGLSARIQHDR